jgi:uncharacterized protein (TIGR02444 family)
MVLSCKKQRSGATQGLTVLETDNPFWRFSLAVYAAPGVAAECLAVQDTRGVDVNVLLFCAWLGTRKIVVTTDDLAATEARVRPWREAAVQPLRAARRGIKTLPDATDNEIAALRKEAAALELRAEQIEQAMLYGIALGGAATTTAGDAIRLNLSALLGHDVPVPRLVDAALAHLEKSGGS